MAVNYRHVARQAIDLRDEVATDRIPQNFDNMYPRVQQAMDSIAITAREFASDCNAIKEFARAAYGPVGRQSDEDIAIARAKLKGALDSLAKRATKKTVSL